MSEQIRMKPYNSSYYKLKLELKDKSIQENICVSYGQGLQETYLNFCENCKEVLGLEIYDDVRHLSNWLFGYKYSKTVDKTFKSRSKFIKDYDSFVITGERTFEMEQQRSVKITSVSFYDDCGRRTHSFSEDQLEDWFESRVVCFVGSHYSWEVDLRCKNKDLPRTLGLINGYDSVSESQSICWVDFKEDDG